MAAYYNENDPFASSWLKELINYKLIADGEVDSRSIDDICSRDLEGFTQCHFFAGIGGWSRALRMAGWPDDRAVWTGSCPCQPFSLQGSQLGFTDERHLWPSWFFLLEQQRPSVIFGEQVAHGAALSWIELVRNDLEALDYSFGVFNLAAGGAGAPHLRQRHFFVAEAVGHTYTEGLSKRVSDTGIQRTSLEPSTGETAERASYFSFWDNSEWLLCSDVYRPIEPGTFPLAYGVPARVGRVRGYGNAIVPQVATSLIKAYLQL